MQGLGQGNELLLLCRRQRSRACAVLVRGLGAGAGGVPGPAMAVPGRSCLPGADRRLDRLSLVLEALGCEELRILRLDLRRGLRPRPLQQLFRVPRRATREKLYQTGSAIIFAPLVEAQLQQVHHDLPSVCCLASIAEPRGDELLHVLVLHDVKNTVTGQEEPVARRASVYGHDLRKGSDLACGGSHVDRLELEVPHGTADSKGTIDSERASSKGAVLDCAASGADPLSLVLPLRLVVLRADQLLADAKHRARVSAVRKLHAELAWPCLRYCGSHHRGAAPVLSRELITQPRVSV
mmetsp:Transcript_62525/g.141042  ORF Transcript_62525/g.141042 Transcript_62525/m.141042 type:complete len:295 (+) Transcript_62525:175-1059(+)